MKNKIDFDIETALQVLKDGKGITGKDGVLTPLIQQLTEAAMKAELEKHLESENPPNRKTDIARKR
jgi:hypothetical protein